MSQTDVQKEEQNNRRGIQVIARAASILRLLENEKDGLSLSEIAKRSKLPRSTVQRIVVALGEEDLVGTTNPNSQITLGPAIQRMAASSMFDYGKLVRPHLEALALKTGETVDLSMLKGQQMVFVDQIPANHRLSAISAVGSSFPAFSSANGKAALALLPNDKITSLYEKGLFKETEHTITDLSVLLGELVTIRDTHLAIDNEEHTEGISAVGTAFRDPAGNIYAVSVPVPTIRFNRSTKGITEALLVFRRDFIG